MRTPSSKLSVGKILRRNEKQNRQARKIVCLAFVFFSLNQNCQNRGDAPLQIVRRRSCRAIKPRKTVCRAVVFSLKHQIVKRGKILREKLSASMKNVSYQVVKPSFARPIWLPLTDGTICRAGIRSSTLSADTKLMRERRYARSPPPDLTYSFCCGLAIQSAPDY